MKELLERLKVADTETWEEIVDWIGAKKGAKFEGYDTDLAHALIQDSLQRAIATKEGWYFSVVKFSEYKDRYHALVEPPLKAQIQYDHPIHVSNAPSPAAALLAAYLEALEG
jgi:hypothetical protein